MVCAALNVTMKVQKFYDVDTPAPFYIYPVETNLLAAWQTVEELMRGTDVVSITNFGAHYDIGNPNDALGRNVSAWAHEAQQNRYNYMLHRIREEKQNHPRSCHFLRKTFHQHFPGGSGIYREVNKTLQKEMKINYQWQGLHNGRPLRTAGPRCCHS